MAPTIHQLHQTGWCQKAIAAHVGVSPKTVRRSRGSHVAPFIPYLVSRWDAGCTNATHLFREIQAQGFPGQSSTVRAFVHALRKRDQHPSMHRPVVPAGPRMELAARRTLVTWMLRDPAQLTAKQTSHLAWMTEQSPVLATTLDLTRTFTTLVRTRSEGDFGPWLVQMEQCDLSAFRRLAKSFRHDEATIRAALTLPWSQGLVEGTIHRLKLLKRQMYGRAKLDLLRQRLLARC